MSTGIIGLIEDDQLITNQLLSFCDFYSAVAVGRTCHRLKRCSDEALDNWAVIAASRDVDGDGEIPIAVGHFHYSDDSETTSMKGELSWWWSVEEHQNTFTSKEAADYILGAIRQMKSGEMGVEHELDESDFELWSLLHYTFCLLRKADPASIGFSVLEMKYSAPFIGTSSSYVWTVGFILPGNKYFEFLYSYKNETS